MICTRTNIYGQMHERVRHTKTERHMCAHTCACTTSSVHASKLPVLYICSFFFPWRRDGEVVGVAKLHDQTLRTKNRRITWYLRYYKLLGQAKSKLPWPIFTTALEQDEDYWEFKSCVTKMEKLPEASKRLASPEGSQGSQRLPPRGSLPEAPSQRLPKAPKASGDSRNFQTPRDSQRHLYTSLLYFIYILSISYPIFYPISYLFFFYILSHLWTGKFDSS